MDDRKFSCETATGTLTWITAISEFLRPYRWLTDAHLVKFFQGRLWEAMGREWLECLRNEPVENLLRIPSGFVKEEWPLSLQEFVITARSLALPRERRDWQMVAPAVNAPLLCNVLSQGMNMKKKHEVEILAAIVKTIADEIDARIVIDVGAGQGYLAQVLSFQCQLSVIALDASPHHATVTSDRAARIRKHYLAQARKQNGKKNVEMPQTITCNVLSSDALTELSENLCQRVDPKFAEDDRNHLQTISDEDPQQNASTRRNWKSESSVLLAGLHACGDLSVNMLRSFLNGDNVKAVVSIGCCYNLLSEDCHSADGAQRCGFPSSQSVKLTGLAIGKNARDLACQSAERWRHLTTKVAHQNFEMHAFRAAFQLALCRRYPEVAERSPSIGRQGKAYRRQQLRKAFETQVIPEDKDSECFMVGEVKDDCAQQRGVEVELRDDLVSLSSSCNQSKEEALKSVNANEREHPTAKTSKCLSFKEFCKCGLDRLGLGESIDVDFHSIWEEALPYCEFIGPYWSLRAALGPLLETLILLDRLLFLQEQGSSVKAILFPLFDPLISPRNMAIIARKVNPDAEKQ